MEKLNQVHDFYENYNEQERLIRHTLEFERSKEIISRYIQPGMTIADIGGAAGIYSFWLARQGYDVHLLDLTDKHIEQAKEYSKNSGIPLASCCVGDALDLPYEDNQFDISLVMGPLYHLQKRQDRMKCLTEARRVLKDKGFIISAYISRYASLIDGFKFSFVTDPEFRKILDQDLTNGIHINPQNNPHYFTSAYFAAPEEVRQELLEAGFKDIKVLAVEGFANALNEDEIMNDENRRKLVMDYLRKTEEVSELIGVSSHYLAIASK